MSKPVMSTVDKALSLLRHFSLQRPELGLSELARLAEYDKTTTPEALEDIFAKTRARGFARAEQSYEDDVIGTAVAFFGPNGRPAGAIAVAAVASRFDAALAAKIEQELVATGHKLTRELGGIAPAALSSIPEHAT